MIVLVQKVQAALIACLFLLGCGPTDATKAGAIGSTSAGSDSSPDTLGAYKLTGNTSIVRDPSIVRQGGTYYSFSTDPPSSAPAGYLPVRCSVDKVAWQACGYVFSALPDWVKREVPSARGLWAPDISYFGGVYHLYYAASTLDSQVSAIGQATNATLDASSTDFRWVDRGEVLAYGATDAASTIKLWQNSPEHNILLLSPNFTQAGIGIDGLYWSMDMGSLNSTAIPSPPLPVTSIPTLQPTAVPTKVCR